MYREHIKKLFKESERGIYTCAAGYSHANFDQLTELSRYVHRQMLSILNYCGIDYYLFAGSIVGYVRNQTMPYWLDDLDIILFEEEIEKFEENALPIFKKCGFNCFYQERYQGGGYHILAMQLDNRRETSIPLTPSKNVKIPWSQIDVFYTVVDSDGFIRNPAEWGIYGFKNIPESWVKPGKKVSIDGLKFKLFSKYEEDILKEYGDVLNNVIVSNHSTVFMELSDVPWEDFDKEFRLFISESTSLLPPPLTPNDISRYEPVLGVCYISAIEESFASIVENIIGLNAERVHLTSGDQIFWVMDLKRLFPRLQVHVEVKSSRDANCAAQLREFISDVSCENDALRVEYQNCLENLNKILGF